MEGQHRPDQPQEPLDSKRHPDIAARLAVLRALYGQPDELASPQHGDENPPDSETREGVAERLAEWQALSPADREYVQQEQEYLAWLGHAPLEYTVDEPDDVPGGLIAVSPEGEIRRPSGRIYLPKPLTGDEGDSAFHFHSSPGSGRIYLPEATDGMPGDYVPRDTYLEKADHIRQEGYNLDIPPSGSTAQE